MQCPKRALPDVWEVSVPGHVAALLSGWGPELSQKVDRAWQCWRDRNLGSVRPQVPTRCPLIVGTDFSGIESPIFALRELGIPFRHAFACECRAAPRDIAALNCLAECTFADILKRRLSDVPPVQLYVSGFPCTPFSMLHHDTKLLQDKNAKQFRASVRTLAHVRPAVAIFENVLGVKRVLSKVTKALECGGAYRVVRLDMNPVHLGEPQNRPRLYFVAVRADVAICNQKHMQEAARFVWESLRERRPWPCDSQLLPSNHPQVMAKHLVTRRLSQTGKQKWKEHHQKFVLPPLIKPPSAIGGLTSALPMSAELGLTSPREIDHWNRLRQACSPGTPLCVDITQSLGRSFRTDGRVPTITPSGKFVVVCGSVRRQLVGIEKLMLQGFPVQSMRFPKHITSSMIGACAGNAMHVKCIAVAILLGMSFVAEIATAPPQGGAPGGVTSAAEARATRNVTKVRVAHLRGGVTPNLKRRRVESASATACESLFGSWSFVEGGPAHARLEKLDRPRRARDLRLDRPHKCRENVLVSCCRRCF